MFTDKVAVITGAASGIGLGLAKHCAQQGMRVVMSDKDETQLQNACDALGAEGAELIAVSADVSRPEDVDRLANAAYEHYGQVDVLVNNAGVLISGYSWERPPEDWRWILDINLMGVVHGLNSFVPRMLEQGTPGHIVNISSLAGLLAAPLMGPYTVSKQAVIALTETLHYELKGLGGMLKASVVCPGPIQTQIAHSGGDRPVDSMISNEANDQLMQFLDSGISEGLTADECAEKIFAGIRDQKFWILTHEDFKPAYQARADSVLAGTNPVYEAYTADKQ